MREMNAAVSGSGGSADQGPTGRSVAALLLVLSVLFAASLVHHAVVSRPATLRGTPLTTLDPNTAPWWELALLPRVGPRDRRSP
jgi:hypothetical protein